ncbi:MAG TPA: hypothetical protein PLC76_02445 [Saprospiraceae bacterium]|jgi:hypothetical protein|nr:hypothetical protein [Saprospiraceae bacterium]HRP83554.1 hypothetical protein [Saprospiraceae bacterium]
MINNFKSLSLKAFQQRFTSTYQCIDYLVSIKWPGEFICKQCYNNKYCKGKKYGDRQCTLCKKIESPKAGTLFHSMKIPLETAFYMLFLIVTDKKGCPSTHLARQTGLQQKTCWLFRRKVMAAMESDHQHLLEGEVDLVEIELNVMKKGKNKTKELSTVKVLIGIEKKGKGASKTYAKVIGHPSKKKTQFFIEQKIDNQARICPDRTIYTRLKNCKSSESEGRNKTLDQRIIRCMLNWVYDRHGYVTHAQEYLNEYCYRYNRHQMKAAIIEDIIRRMVFHKPRPYKLMKYS